MKIAINARFLLKGKMEGIGRYTYEISKRLVAQHPEHHFLFYFDRPYHDDFIFGNNVTPFVLLPPARHELLILWWFERSVAKALKAHKADLFLSFDNFCCLKTDVRTILVLHDLAYRHRPQDLSWARLRFYTYFTPKYLKKADKIIAVSQFTKQDIIHQFNIDPQKIAVAYNAGRPIFKPVSALKKQAIQLRYAEDKPYFFYIGSINPRKNIVGLIKAFDIFKEKTQSDYHLLIAGRWGWKEDDVKETFYTAKYKADIVFLGYVPDENLPDLVGSAFALTYISHFEGFGIPIIESMQCAVPTISSNTSAMPEVVNDAGLSVNPSAPEEIAEAMIALYSDTKLYKKLQERSLQQALAFDWGSSTQVFDTVIKELL